MHAANMRMVDAAINNVIQNVIQTMADLLSATVLLFYP